MDIDEDVEESDDDQEEEETKSDSEESVDSDLDSMGEVRVIYSYLWWISQSAKFLS